MAIDWTPISQEIPPEGKRVLIYSKKTGCIDIGALYSHCEYDNSYTFRNFQPRFFEYFNPINYLIHDVTHWANLPEPPKGEMQ